MPPSKSGRCCQSIPRCKACPVWRAAELVALGERGAHERDLPPHLVGVPSCLHKYEVLLREAWERRQNSAADGQSSAVA